MTQPLFTPGAERAMQRAATLALQSNSPSIEPVHLLWALFLDESRASEIAAAHGLTHEILGRHLPLGPESISIDMAAASISESAEAEPGDELRTIVIEARRQAARLGKNVEIGSEHLLCGLALVPSPVQELLAAHGLAGDIAAERSLEQAGQSSHPLEVDIQLSLPDFSAADATDVFRILDAAANRAREGLRVVEDYVRFTLDDRHLTGLLKSWRHRLAEVLSAMDFDQLVSSRDTRADVGTTVKTPREGLRQALAAVVIANFKRVQEAARTLEECGKVLSSDLGRRFEALRYELYTLEKAVAVTHASRERLVGRDLYVLVSSDICPHGSGPVIRTAAAAGAGIIQVREKKMSDRELTTYGKYVRNWTAQAGALFIMNDRPDLAVLTDADGVHVGQDELTVREARRIVGPARLVGVSTHTIEQARQAVLDGADYIGLGPVFSSSTKNFSQLAGLDFVRQVTAEITLPAFAIGGIKMDNIDQVIAAGAVRVAVSGAICGAEDPGEATRVLRAKLDAAARRTQ